MLNNVLKLLKKISNDIKDDGLSFALRKIVNLTYIKKIGGCMSKFQLDSAKNEISISLDLIGEQSPIDIIIKYQIISPSCIGITNVVSSREWIANLANEIIPNESKQIMVPENVVKILSQIR